MSMRKKIAALVGGNKYVDDFLEFVGTGVDSINLLSEAEADELYLGINAAAATADAATPGQELEAEMLRKYVARHNAILASLQDGYLTAPGLRRGRTDPSGIHCEARRLRVNRIDYFITNYSENPFSDAFVVSQVYAGAVLVQEDNDDNVTTKVAADPQAYNTVDIALAHLPAPDPGNIMQGYILIRPLSGTDFTANTGSLDESDADLFSVDFFDAPLVPSLPA